VNVSVNHVAPGPGRLLRQDRNHGDAQTPASGHGGSDGAAERVEPGAGSAPHGIDLRRRGPTRNPPAQAVNVTNIISQPVAFTSAQLTFDGGKWLSQSPLTATVVPNTPGKVNVQSDNTALTAGVRRGVVTMLFDDGRSQNVSVLSVVTPQPTPDAKAQDGPMFAAGCQSPNLRVQFVSLRDDFQVVVGQPATVQVKVVDECGNPLVPDSSASTPVSASFSNGDPDIRLAHEGNGQWAGTCSRPTNRPATVTVHAAYVRLGSQQTMQTGTAQLKGTLRSGSAPIVPPGRCSMRPAMRHRRR